MGVAASLAAEVGEAGITVSMICPGVGIDWDYVRRRQVAAVVYE